MKRFLSAPRCTDIQRDTASDFYYADTRRLVAFFISATVETGSPPNEPMQFIRPLTLSPSKLESVTWFRDDAGCSRAKDAGKIINDETLSRRRLSYVSLDLMRYSLLIAFSALFASVVAADIKPADSSKPLFRILKFKTMHEAQRKGDEAKGEVDDKHPLLVVWKLFDVRLAHDYKGVQIVLTRDDARAFADITRGRLRYLLFDTGEPRSLEVLQIAAPVTDGVIDFKYPEDAAQAEYLRRRFRLGEFRSGPANR
jgi:hypothetical protein